MILQNHYKQVNGFEGSLELVSANYIGRPVTLDRTTIAGLQPNDAGRYIIPQGTFLTGGGVSLLEQPQQIAKQAQVTVTKATATFATHVTIKAKQEGAVTYTLTTVDPAAPNKDIAVSVDTSTKTVTVSLKTNSKKAIISTLKDVVDAVNEDILADTYLVATVADGHEDDIATAATATTSGGGAESVTGIIDGILYHSVDVTDGEATGAMMIAGVVNMDKLATAGAAVQKALPSIKFGRRD